MENKIPTVYLHVGIGKTGTSATQRLLATNIARLAEIGICYPSHPMVKDAVDGKITSGNIIPKASDSAWFKTLVMDTVHANPGHQTYVFSSEGMVWTLPDQLETIREYSDRFRFEVILAVREPLDLELSAYGQAVKRHGYFKEAEDFIGQQTHLAPAVRLAKAMQSIGVAVHLLNYSVLKRGITAAIFDVIGAPFEPGSDADTLQKSSVNRSLTQAELKLMKSLNRHFEPLTALRCSDALVQELPDLAGEHVQLDQAFVDSFHDRCRPYVEYLNQFLSPDQQLKMTYEPATDPPKPMSSSQYDVVFAALRREFDRPSRSSITQAWLAFRDDVRRRLRVID